MKLSSIKARAKLVTLVKWDGRTYMGVASLNSINYAVDITGNSFMPRKWLGALYNDEHQTISLGKNADVATIPFNVKQQEQLAHYVFNLEYAEKYTVQNLITKEFMNMN